MNVVQERPTVTTAIWQLAFDPEYGALPDGRVYAGYIFRLEREHAQRIDIPDEAMAIQVANWLNEREELLAVRRAEALV